MVEDTMTPESDSSIFCQKRSDVDVMRKNGGMLRIFDSARARQVTRLDFGDTTHHKHHCTLRSQFLCISKQLFKYELYLGDGTFQWNKLGCVKVSYLTLNCLQN